MKHLQLFDANSSTHTYVLFDDVSREAVIIDPVDAQVDRDLAVLRQYGLKLIWTLQTHAHADHITSAGQLAELTGAKTAAPEGCGICTAALQIKEGDVLRFGDEQLVARHTPGRPAGSMSYLWRDHLFTGDALPILWTPRPAQGYAGDVSPQLACQWWLAGEAVLIDVRTDAEREWVGFVPGAVPLAWKQWPGMALNSTFDEGLKIAALTGKKLVFLCRSGVRSVATAKRATELGLEGYNILEGFEGNPDTLSHRGRLGGWRFYGLPWRQG